MQDKVNGPEAERSATGLTVVRGRIYADRWMTPYICIAISPMQSRIALQFEFWNPDIPEFENNEIVIRGNHRLLKKETELHPGTRREVSLQFDPFNQRHGLPFYLSIRSLLKFSLPAPDTRDLAIVVEKINFSPALANI